MSSLDCTLVDLFEEQVERSPEATAVVYEGSSLRYRELNERANRIAHWLAKQGIGTEDIVGICLPRSLEMVETLLGVLKAGAAYLPLDPGYPRERLTWMVEDAKPAIVFRTKESGSGLPNSIRQILLDEPEAQKEVGQEKKDNLGQKGRIRPLQKENAAYVIYTSGSTGQPKGVVIEQGSPAILMRWGREIIDREALSGV